MKDKIIRRFGLRNNPYYKWLILLYAASIRRLGMSNNPVGVGLLVEQGWRVQRAYPVYSRQRGNKAVGLGLFPLCRTTIVGPREHSQPIPYGHN
ncbi:hypothetical protein J5A66_03725 [Prevotella sp. oral taxon 475]|uniref:hypothetical protein n=1 Tax=Prevotella sp. oral taxon 475 TaxID=712471 RepID=UPI001BA485FA|nr:hypothetical protein [Prevotella sp. oral taxon 475]QUB47915.1 hypothetical protein J5A66_03725 [Prevotella sp. oral taxon 475]